MLLIKRNFSLIYSLNCSFSQGTSLEEKPKHSLRAGLAAGGAALGSVNAKLCSALENRDLQDRVKMMATPSISFCFSWCFCEPLQTSEVGMEILCRWLWLPLVSWMVGVPQCLLPLPLHLSTLCFLLGQEPSTPMILRCIPAHVRLPISRLWASSFPHVLMPSACCLPEILWGASMLS